MIPGLSTETRTDADGRFTLTGLGRDWLVSLSVAAPDVVDTDLAVMTRNAPDVPTFPINGKPTSAIHGANFTLRLKRGLTIYGVVRDRANGAPIPGMWVTMNWNPLTDPLRTEDVTVSDENGRFAISGLDPESTQRTVTAIPRPGGQYLMAHGIIKQGGGVLIECAKGIPFRLKVVDEQGKPVEGSVEYWPVYPNPQIKELIKPLQPSSWPIMDRAARRTDGTYEGFVLPGPGAVMVQMPDRRSYRPAHVDPKAFFEPGQTNWPEQSSNIYGTPYTLQSIGAWFYQDDYAAIVLVNPAKNSRPLELSAAVVHDRPRQVSLIDPGGKPIVGADMIFGNGYGSRIRAASFPLTGLHPDIMTRRTFVKEDRRLVGFLKARGDGDAPYTVRMQSWGTVTGRIVDINGKPFDTPAPFFAGWPIVTDDTDGFNSCQAKLEPDGQFRIDRLMPGVSYRCVEIYRTNGNLTGQVFDKLVLKPGEVRELGDVRVKPAK